MITGMENIGGATAADMAALPADAMSEATAADLGAMPPECDGWL